MSQQQSCDLRPLSPRLLPITRGQDSSVPATHARSVHASTRRPRQAVPGVPINAGWARGATDGGSGRRKEYVSGERRKHTAHPANFEQSPYREPPTNRHMKPCHRSYLIPPYHYYDVLYTLLLSTIIYTTILQAPPCSPPSLPPSCLSPVPTALAINWRLGQALPFWHAQQARARHAKVSHYLVVWASYP